jgi:hypothetical protein
VAALGGSTELGRTIAGGTPLGKDIGTPDEEEFASQAMAWAIRFADAPEFSVDGGDSALCKSVEWLLGQHAADPGFSTVVGGNPRSPKKVMAAAARDAMSMELRRLQTSGQRFLRNPRGVKPFLKRGVMAAFGSAFDAGRPEWLEKLKALGLPQDLPSMSEEPVPNSWHGDEYEPSDREEAFLANTKNLRKATVRIEEIMSFEYMQHVGDTMRNCLRVERRGGQSLMKYLSRAKTRESSFWVMTITADGDEDDTEEAAGEAPVQHLLLVELYNQMGVIHQAEGPHPRRWPRADAWRWLQEWAAQEGLRPDGPEGVTVGPYGGYFGDRDPWDINRCFLW